MKHILILCLHAISLATFAQLPPFSTVRVPMESQKAMVMQRIGSSDVTITYSRPAVKGRPIWGTQVPYNSGKPFPWRAGANENTTIEFTDDAEVEGKSIKAGKYGLHMIPSAVSCIIMFSKNNTAWGSFSYRDSEDVLRFEVTPKPGQVHQELLQYEFSDLTDSSAIVSLNWEKLQIPFKVNFDTKKIMVENIESLLRTPTGFTAVGWNSAATYLNKKNYELERALKYADRAVAYDDNYTNNKLKAAILRKLNKSKQADSVIERSVKLSGLSELVYHGGLHHAFREYKEASMLLEEAYSRYPHTFKVCYFLALVKRGMGEEGIARKYQAEAKLLASNPSDKKTIEDDMKKSK